MYRAEIAYLVHRVQTLDTQKTREVEIYRKIRKICVASRYINELNFSEEKRHPFRNTKSSAAVPGAACWFLLGVSCVVFDFHPYFVPVACVAGVSSVRRGGESTSPKGNI